MTGEKAWHSRPRALHGPGVEGEAEGACRGQRVDLEREALLGRPPWCKASVPGSALPPPERQGWSRNWRVTACGILPSPKIQLPSLCPSPRPLQVPLLGEMCCRSSLAPHFLLCPPSLCGFPPLSWVTLQWPALFLVVWMES